MEPDAPPPARNLIMPSGVLGFMSSGVGQAEVVIEEHQDQVTRLARLYALHAPRAGRLAYLLTGDPELAQDLAQEAFVRLMGRLSAIRDDAVVAAYLRRSIVNLVRKHWRKLGYERRYLRGGLEGVGPAPEPAPGPDRRDELWRALGRLPSQQRAAIVLRFYEDLSERDTARVLGCALGTVKSSVSRGLQRMREEMVDDADLRD
jgi:RNA polymerase sigma-70 factor (sigma-E family)